jgi:hypothetical protein
MNLDGDLTGAEFSRGLLVEETRYHQGQDLSFARGQQPVTPSQFREFCSLYPSFAILEDARVNASQEFLIIERLQEKLDSSGFHGTNR